MLNKWLDVAVLCIVGYLCFVLRAVVFGSFSGGKMVMLLKWICKEHTLMLNKCLDVAVLFGGYLCVVLWAVVFCLFSGGKMVML